ncbi:YitT family protein [Terrimonas pollutisoli]|uniref:YitT family protein n=1 Tax=Terrimonas pollutisoli TaxID=3034147 RepID=UPI0023ECF3AB|nr:YitT family protein [Terrimonas sp. H1YJ31]
MTNRILSNLREKVEVALGKTEFQPVSRYQKAKHSWRVQRTIKDYIRSAVLVALGVLSAGFGLKSFLMPNNFIDGGVTGISLLVNAKTGLPFAALIIIFNLPFILLGWKQISKGFSLKSVVAITLLALAVVVIPYPMVTDDKLLVAVFGGFFLGAGIGFTIRGGAVIDGTEILAIFFSRKQSLSVGDFILVFNILIFSAAAYLLSVEIAMYAMLTYLAASKTVDFVLEGVEEFTGVTIISNRSDEIAEFIKQGMGRGLTIYSGRRGFGKRGENFVATDILFTVVTRLEISRLTNEIEKIDPNAFIVMQSIRDTKGGMVKKRPLKE